MPRIVILFSWTAISSMLFFTSAFQFSSNRGISQLFRHSVPLFSSAIGSDVIGISRIEILQTLLSKWGAPGSSGCADKDDLQPIYSIDGNDMLDLHPLLTPIAKSSKTGNLVCALKSSGLEIGVVLH